MSLGDFLDRCIEPFAPATAARRQAVRIGLNAIRQFDAAQHDRRTKGWRRPSTNADSEIARSIVALRNSGHDLVRNNKYAASAVMNGVAHMIGDGITARAVHSDEAVQQAAQDEWDRWSASPVHEGVNDHFHAQKLIGRALYEGGEVLQVWAPNDDGIPDSEVVILEGDYIDHTKTQRLPSGKIVQGVQYQNNKRVGYWLYADHPGDAQLGASWVSKFTDARDIDHIFEQLRPGQARGISWFTPTALDFRDIADTETAMHFKKKIENCLGLVLTAPEGETASPVDLNAKAAVPGQAPQEKMTPGMIFRAKAGEQATVINPTPTNETIIFIKQQLAAASATLVPYFIMTGDTAGANYTTLRAMLLAFGARLDDVQQNIIIPHCCQSAFARRMRIRAADTGDRRFLEVSAQWAIPGRPQLDPVKELMAEIVAIRAGLVTLSAALAKRGIDVNKQCAEIARIDKLIDALGLALDVDPRRVTGAGILQAAAGYLAPKGDASNN